MPTSTATAVWDGKLRDGSGSFRAGSGAFAGAYTFKTRFEGAAGTTPEELIAAAEAACFSMALSAGLEKAGTPATRVETTARCTLERGEGGFRITAVDLSVRGSVPGADAAAFQAAAAAARDNCPVSRALKGNVAITMEASLV